MQKLFLFLILFSFLLLFNSCGDNITQGEGVKCDTSADCNGGMCDEATGKCLNYACSPSENSCLADGKTAKVCNADRSGFEELPCSFRCNKGECIDNITCSPYTKMCVTDIEYIECTSNGLEWEKTKCEGDKLCLDGECTDKVCTPLEKTCIDDFHVKSCNANGTAELNYKCPNGQNCLDGSCLEKSCTANDSKCVNGKLVTCESDGSTWGEAVDCGSNEACSDGVCKDIICTVNEIVCSTDSNRYYKKCDGTSTGWGNPVLCGTDKVCDNNTCVDKLCSPGEQKCDASGRVLTCNDNSLSWSNPVNCSASEVCKRGVCTTTGTCVANERRCLDGNDAYFEACDEWGTGWLNPISCGAGKICASGVCEALVCVPGELKCDATDLSMTKYEVCNTDGTAYLAEETCTEGEICLGDICRTITCTPGEKICNVNDIMICKDDGSGWEASSSCGAGQACVTGGCVDTICTPLDKRCVDGTSQFIEVCDATGTFWENRQSCGTGSICSNNACVDLECSPGQTKCDGSSDSYLTCDALGSAWGNDLTACENGDFCMSGKCMQCFPDATECTTDTSFKTCNSDGQWEVAVNCANDDKCENGSCAVLVCTPNEIKCFAEDKQYYETCNSLGTAWLNLPASCGAGKICETINEVSICKTITCVKNATECVDSSSYKLCNDNGTAYATPVNCDAGTECLAGSCRVTICTPGDKICDNNGIKECNELGQWGAAISCGTQACEDGDRECSDIICTPTAFQCDDNNREQCNSSGTAWINNVPCGAGKVCTNTICKDIICTEDETRCIANENKYEICNELGTAYDSSVACTNDEYCSLGACVAQVCIPNEKICDPDNTNSVKICNELGSSSTSLACTDDMICDEGTCIPTLCSENQTRCSGNQIQTCSADKMGWDIASDCSNDGSETCSGDICILRTCADNEKVCVNDLSYKVCNSSGTGYDTPITCGAGKVCNSDDGLCIDRTCVPLQIECIDTDPDYTEYKRCNSTGSAWKPEAENEDCTAPLLCDTDTDRCISPICEPNKIRCLGGTDNPQSQKCNPLGTAWLDPITCGDANANPICTETGCDNVICVAYEEISCTDPSPGAANSEYRRCNEYGTDWIETTENCQGDYLCKDINDVNQCVPVICNLGDRVCSSNSETKYSECINDGTELDIEKACEVEPHVAGNVPMICYAGECKERCDMAAVNKSYMGCYYYAIELENYDGTYDDGTYAIIVSNPNNYEASITISGPNEIFKTANIALNSLATFTFADDNRNFINGTAHGTNYSYFITSNLPIVVYQFSPLGGSTNYTNDASLIIPTTAYGTEYRMLGWHTSYNSQPQYMTIIAKEDNTVVTVYPKVNTQAGGGIPIITTSYEITLTEGEAVQFAGSTDSGGSLSGSLISSTKPIGVFSGNNCIQVPDNKTACDHIEQQLFPTNTWGNNYLAVKTNQRGTENDYYKIVANEDNTIVTLTPNVSGTSPITMNAGDVIEFNTDLDFKISSSKPVMVGQFMASQNAGAGTGDPAFILQVPTEQFREDYLFLTPDTYANDFVTIVAPKTATVTLNGEVIPNSDFTDIGATDYMKAIISLDDNIDNSVLNDGPQSIVATEPVGISVYGYDRYVSYGYPGGLNLKAVK